MAVWNSIVEKYVLELKTDTPMHVGSASGQQGEVLIHPVEDVPFLQASSLAGVLRSVSEILNGEEETERLFGSKKMDAEDVPASAGSRVRISDGTFKLDTVHFERRPRVAIDPVSGSVSDSTISGSGRTSGHKFEMEMVAAGAEVSFQIYLFHGEEDQDKEALEAILAEMAAGHLQFGGQKSNGAGFLTLQKLLYRSFLLTQEEDRKAWYREEELKPSDYTDVADKLVASSHSIQAYDIVVTGKTEGAILVKSASVTDSGPGAPDAENMKNASGQYIVPGSSLKGALRNQVSLIAKRLDKKGLVEAMFGTGGQKDSEGTRGNVVALDTVIGKDARQVMEKLQHRIHIDIFTGGVMQTGLFTERTVSGDVALHMVVNRIGNPEAAVGMITLAFRDLAAGLWNLGSGFNVGRGFISVDKIEIRPIGSEDVTELCFADQKIVDEKNRLQTYLHAVEEWKEQ